MTRSIRRASRPSFRSRLSSLTALAVGLTVALAAVGTYLAVSHELFSGVDSSLQSELSNLPTGPDNTLNPCTAANGLRRYSGSLLQLNLANGTEVYPNNQIPLPFCHPPAGQTELPFIPATAFATGTRGTTSLRTVTVDGTSYRVISRSVQFSGLGPGVLQIARPINDIDHTLKDLRLILLVATLGGIGLAIALGSVIGRATMRPVVRLTAAAEHVTATSDLQSRIPEQGDDELARLAHSFNEMLSALSTSRQQQAQLISDAGHELRTPLTSLRTNIEVLMRAPDLPDVDRADLLADVQAQLEEMTTLVADVVELARQDERRGGPQPEPIEVRFDDIILRAVDRARRRASGVTFEPTLTSGSVRANPGLLERAVLNVLDNAAKWSPPGGTVTIYLRRADRWILEVRDHGAGIAQRDLPRVFDRFYRADSARSMPGSGLGLAIVHDVVTSHGGRVSVWSPADGGTLVRIELPTVPEAEPDVGAERDASAPVGSSPRSEPQPVEQPLNGATPSHEGGVLAPEHLDDPYRVR